MLLEVLVQLSGSRALHEHSTMPSSRLTICPSDNDSTLGNPRCSQMAMKSQVAVAEHGQQQQGVQWVEEVLPASVAAATLAVQAWVNTALELVRELVWELVLVGLMQTGKTGPKTKVGQREKPRSQGNMDAASSHNTEC